MSPDNTITIHYGEGNNGTQIQLSDGQVDIQSSKQINITSDNSIKLESPTIVINGKDCVQIKGQNPGQCAVNSKELYRILLSMAKLCDNKVPSSSGQIADIVSGSVANLYNEQIQYI